MAQPDAESNKNLDLPSVSKPGAGDGEPIAMIPPQIEGYDILSPLGQAGQGQVWRAVQMGTHRHVAIKIPHIRFIASRKSLLRFEREVELAARMEHRNIAQIYESGVHQGLYYYAMEYVDGVHLDAFVQDHHLSVRQTVELMRTVCAAVQYAHQKGIIHRDLKPSNILVTQEGQPYLLDFGLARSVLTDRDDPTISTEGELAGTPAYMSPEQAQGSHDQLDTRTDVYSLGIILYRLLTRQFPYPVDHSVAETLSNIIQAEPVRPCRIAKQLDPELECIILKTLAKEPEQRYQSAAELRADLDNWLQGLPITAKSGQTLYVIGKMISKHRYASAVVFLVIVILTSNLFTSLYFYHRSVEYLKEVNSLSAKIMKETQYTIAATFLDWLDEWQNGRPMPVEIFERYMPEKSRELTAIHYLLKVQSKPDPDGTRDPDLGQEPQWFEHFLRAEAFLKFHEIDRASELYEKSRLELEKSRPDERWYTKHIEARLYHMGHSNTTDTPGKKD
jgi:serine/threonine protein kinase